MVGVFIVMTRYFDEISVNTSSSAVDRRWWYRYLDASWRPTAHSLYVKHMVGMHIRHCHGDRTSISAQVQPLQLVLAGCCCSNSDKSTKTTLNSDDANQFNSCIEIWGSIVFDVRRWSEWRICCRWCCMCRHWHCCIQAARLTSLFAAGWATGISTASSRPISHSSWEALLAVAIYRLCQRATRLLCRLLGRQAAVWRAARLRKTLDHISSNAQVQLR